MGQKPVFESKKRNRIISKLESYLVWFGKQYRKSYRRKAPAKSR